MLLCAFLASGKIKMRKVDGSETLTPPVNSHHFRDTTANAAFDLFVETNGVKYECAVAKQVNDCDVLLTYMTSRPKIVGTSEPRTRLKASLPWFGTAPEKQKGA